MNHTFGQVPGSVRPVSEVIPHNGGSPSVKEIPYDYVATFSLQGKRGNRIQDVLNISTDGAFVAVSIGYSFIPANFDVYNFPDQRVIDFKYSIVDSGSGRELQNKPIHNIAGLGEPNGNRPFRPFAKPMLFMPRSTIRIEIEEVLDDPEGLDAPYYNGAQLFIVFHGYKLLGYGTGPL